MDCPSFPSDRNTLARSASGPPYRDARGRPSGGNPGNKGGAKGRSGRRSRRALRILQAMIQELGPARELE
jgi:hypothetical protein